ncbi:(3R)-hydroxyacyl-ACP dehydratase subunit HadC [Mycolicibacterium baixiangningiae]|uniref:(3R)-hydroxyacyl-ACP dehydratase subunit HadC n=1 Tax=Mycolicibacterium baixiangningiae TaxID=2761578 RepID=UPI0018664B7A|nr:(3R)-hydroxyacyl-ACP dehydratase subunit HadC [Mycolicibacterium baixiangningiae]
MAFKVDIQGMVWRYPGTFIVGREQIRQYANSVKVTDPVTLDEGSASEMGHRSIVAPLTFPAVFAYLIQQDFFRSVDIGMESVQMMQVAQRFVYHKPIMAGDVLRGVMYIESVVERFGADIVGTRSECTNERGELVLEGHTTMMGRHEDMSDYLRWDAEAGLHVRAPNWRLDRP